MSWTTNHNGTLYIALGVNHYAQVEDVGQVRWQAYIGRLMRSNDTYGPTRLEKWGVASEFESYSDAKIWCERMINAQANLAER